MIARRIARPREESDLPGRSTASLPAGPAAASQQIEDVVALTWEDVSVTDDLVTITLGGFAIELREPLDAPWRSLAVNPGNNLTAAHPNSRGCSAATPPASTSTP